MITALKNAFTGLIKPAQHSENSRMHGGWMFLLIFLLSVFTAILFVQPMNKLKNDPNFDEMFRQLPQFTYSNGELVMEETYMLPMSSSGGAILFYLDTGTDMNGLGADAVSQLAATYNCPRAMCIVRDGMIVLQAGRAQAVPWTSFLSRDTVINNDNINEKFGKLISTFTIICAVILSVFYIGIYYFCLLIYAVILKIGSYFLIILNLNAMSLMSAVSMTGRGLKIMFRMFRMHLFITKAVFLKESLWTRISRHQTLPLMVWLLE